MARFSMVLPPFAPDYSGVCSALFDLNGLVVIHDAAGCTGNYTGFDEPRWYGSRKAVYCSGLREIDAVLGNEDKFIRRIVEAAKEQKPDFIAFVGSPVPMVIGTDFGGFAKELELTTKLPSFGFATNGLEYYQAGVVMAGRALLDRFAEILPKKARTVNIIGATPLDISAANLKGLTCFLAANHWDVNACLFMGLTMENLRQTAAAELNIAVSAAGVKISTYLRERFGTPYVAGLPVGLDNARDFLSLMQQAASTGEGARQTPQTSGDAAVLAAGEEVFAHSVKNALWSCGIRADAGTLFGSPIYSDTLDLDSETSIADAVNNPAYKRVIADPLICDLAKNRTKVLPISHYAVSSKTRARFDKLWIAGAFEDCLSIDLINPIERNRIII